MCAGQRERTKKLMPDRGDLGVCGTSGCEGEGDHQIICGECGGSFGFLCDDCANVLETTLTVGARMNAARWRERNKKEEADE